MFRLESEFELAGDQFGAVAALEAGARADARDQVLLRITSYNVCYTKLLRHAAAAVVGQAHALGPGRIEHLESFALNIDSIVGSQIEQRLFDLGDNRRIEIGDSVTHIGNFEKSGGSYNFV